MVGLGEKTPRKLGDVSTADGLYRMAIQIEAPSTLSISQRTPDDHRRQPHA